MPDNKHIELFVNLGVLILIKRTLQKRRSKILFCNRCELWKNCQGEGMYKDASMGSPA
jgi:hypothetical protein